MKTYELLDADGRVYAFEVKNSGLGRTGACRVADTIPGAQVTRKPKFLSWFREEVFCDFEVEGQMYVAWEPFGDNSRYWIGPEPPEWRPQTESVREAFETVRSSRIFRWLVFLVGALMVGVGIPMFSDADGGVATLSALSSIVLGAFFINYALTGERTFWAHRMRE